MNENETVETGNVALLEKKKRNKYKNYSDKEVLDLVNQASSLDNLCSLLEMPKANVCVRLSTMRKKGLEVKKFSRKGVLKEDTSTPNTGENNNGTESTSN